MWLEQTETCPRGCTPGAPLTDLQQTVPLVLRHYHRDKRGPPTEAKPLQLGHKGWVKPSEQDCCAVRGVSHRLCWSPEDGGVSTLGDIQKPTGRSPGQPAVSGPAWAGDRTRWRPEVFSNLRQSGVLWWPTRGAGGQERWSCSKGNLQPCLQISAPCSDAIEKSGNIFVPCLQNRILSLNLLWGRTVPLVSIYRDVMCWSRTPQGSPDTARLPVLLSKQVWAQTQREGERKPSTPTHVINKYPTQEHLSLSSFCRHSQKQSWPREVSYFCTGAHSAKLNMAL